jgi:beta-galactosidase/beta-glucuronidase
MHRDKIDLSSNWRYQVDPQNEGERAGYWRADYDDRRWPQISVPCSLEQGHPDLAWYVGAGWYRRPFYVPEAWQGRRIILRFDETAQLTFAGGRCH